MFHKLVTFMIALLIIVLTIGACGPTPEAEVIVEQSAAGSNNTVEDTTEIKADERGSFAGALFGISLLVAVLHIAIRWIVLIFFKSERVVWAEELKTAGIIAASWIVSLTILGLLGNFIADKVTDYWWLIDKGLDDIWFNQVALPWVLFAIGFVVTMLLIPILDVVNRPGFKLKIPKPSLGGWREDEVDDAKTTKFMLVVGKIAIYFVWSFIGVVSALIINLLIEYFVIISMPFGLIVFPFVILFAYSLIRLNAMHCPNCGKKLGRIYGMIPFMVFHDFHLECCKHCHHDLTQPL